MLINSFMITIAWFLLKELLSDVFSFGNVINTLPYWYSII